MANISSIIALTKKEEGGLSRATTDTASKYPSPYIHNGVGGWHTNRGVTYRTFEALANQLGYQNNRENFINMPDDIWLKIAKNGYWDVLNLDAMNSQAIANLFFSWQWAAGYGWRNRIKRYLASKGVNWNTSKLKEIPSIINNLVKQETEKKILDELIEQYKEFYISLNQPANIKGWLNRVDRLKAYAYSLISNSGGVNSLAPILILGIIFSLFFFRSKNK